MVNCWVMLQLRRLLDDLACAGHGLQPGLILTEDLPPRLQYLPRALSWEDDHFKCHSDTAGPHALDKGDVHCGWRSLPQAFINRVPDQIDTSNSCSREPGGRSGAHR